MKKCILILVFSFLQCASFASTSLKINTSNPGKLAEFQRLFAKYDITLSASRVDIAEIESDPATVVAHKASELPEDVLVEDTSLDVEGASVGINVRWLLDHLEEYAGRKATWRVLLAVRHGDMVDIYEGVTFGTLVASSGRDGFGFDPVFLPEGSDKTLAESKPDAVNARAKAVDAFVHKKLYKSLPVIKEWHGSWQQDDQK